MENDILLQIRKPGRYIGKEWNVSKKDFESAEVKFALCFPDLYEVGMSNLGIRILYHILNTLPGVACERFFSPDIDFEAILRDKRIEIYSLESRKKLRDFDIVGFSLGYELQYTNVLSILELGGIPLKASSRDHNFPLIIGGGPCTANPEPMHEFFDLFVIGEAEEAIVEIVNSYGQVKDKFKASKMEKRELLALLARIEGVYAPSLYEVSYTPEGRIERFHSAIKGVPDKIKKRFVNDLDTAAYPVDWLLPYIQIIHDRITLEVMRGCPHRCRFCQARNHYYPFRQRNVEKVLELANRLYASSGYEEIALSGLSVSDYYGIEHVLKALISQYKEKAVSVSLPSIRPKVILEYLSALIASVKKTGLTFAPEAATEKLRAVIAKDFDTEDFFRVVEQAYRAGYQHVKLYFMIGLPFEESKDLDGIIEFASSVSMLKKKINQRPAQVNLSINTLIPKPHTPFQWLGMCSLEDIKGKQDYIRSKVSSGGGALPVRQAGAFGGKTKKLKVDFHNRSMSLIEGVFSRGDRRLSQVILRAFMKGARFDSWDAHFNFERWMEAFKESAIDPNFYLKEKSRNEILPWDFLDMGVSKEYLLQEADAIDKEP